MNDTTIVVSTRIRLARNVRGYGFPCVIKGTKKEDEITDFFVSLFKRLGGFSVCKTDELTALRLRSFSERYLISNKFASICDGALAISDDGLISVMINEEDHIREQIICRGYELEKAYSRIANLDGVLRANVDFSVSGNTYYTACPSNLGTGMRASVMLFLPALSKSGRLMELSAAARSRGLTIRGALGEGSGEDGYFYQVSNEVTYRITEAEIILLVKNFVSDIVAEEEYLRKSTYEADRYTYADHAFRALGTLQCAVRLPYEEFSELISKVKLGISVGIITCRNAQYLDDLLIATRSATLQLNYGTTPDEDVARARFVKENLAKLSLKTIDIN